MEPEGVSLIDTELLRRAGNRNKVLAARRSRVIRKLKEWADGMLPTLRHHLEMARDMAAGTTVGKH
jgi:hypothetical protein